MGVYGVESPAAAAKEVRREKRTVRAKVNIEDEGSGCWWWSLMDDI